MNNTQPKKTIRFLSLGDLQTDRRLKNFIIFFREAGFEVELFYASFKNTSEPKITIEGIVIREIKLTHLSRKKNVSTIP